MKILSRFTYEAIVEKDVDTIKELLEYAVKNGISLKGAYLKGADLSDVNLGDADLSDAELSYSDLAEVDLSGVDLSGANLSNAQNFYSFIAYDTSKRIVYCIKHNDTWMIKVGCFWGTLEELETKVKKTHNSKVYLANIEILKGI